ncbi:kelch repeat-containing protein isoform X2 [Amia ocellicauda]|uniref:kelch repeat-containing protein isoform X2 n=1 Tax=Amia ocellicauda TaxID=2972642 RepID=UPI003463D845
MPGLRVYAVLGTDLPPRQLQRDMQSTQWTVSLPSSLPDQLVVFSQGQWEELPGEVAVELTGLGGATLSLGSLSPHCRCVSWEQDQCVDWKRWKRWAGGAGVTLRVRLAEEDGQMDSMEPLEMLTTEEHTPKVPLSSTTPPSVQDAHRKRKRGHCVKEEEEEEEDGVEKHREAKGGARGRGKERDQENLCPNSGPPPDHRTPQRRVRHRPRSSHVPLFTPADTPLNPPSPKHTVSEGTPSGRWGHSLCQVDPQTAILIGGQGSRMQFCKDPMWKLSTGDLSWVAVETIADGPTPDCRMGHTATFDPEKKRIYVFGGSKNRKWFNDVHILDTESWRWTMVEAQGKVPPLAYHSCSVFRGELFVLGGVFPRPHPQPDGCSDSLYIFNPDMGIWYQPIVLGKQPAPRSGHSACVIQGRLYVFGGWDTPVCFNDTHMLDLGLMEFSAVEVTGAPPSPRSWHGSAVLPGNRFLVHGGYDGNSALSDSFIFNTDSSSWVTLVQPLLSAMPRAGHSIITLANTAQETSELEGQEVPEPRPHTLLLFGGGDNEGGFYSDTLTLAIDELLDQ